jgi:hypothetical protein
MALKGHLWFLGRCLDEERARTPESLIASRLLDLGLKRAESTRSHVFQAVGALQNFYSDHPAIAADARIAPPYEPYALDPAECQVWCQWFGAKTGPYGQARFGYNYDTLRGYLTPHYCGDRTGGGGGNNEFELVARMLAKFV